MTRDEFISRVKEELMEMIPEELREGLEIQGTMVLNRIVFKGGWARDNTFGPGCHDITKTGLTGETASYARNPHSWHHSEYTCSDCHKAHRASIMVCSQCHEDAQSPDGWLSAEEASNLETQYMSWNEEQFLAA